VLVVVLDESLPERSLSTVESDEAVVVVVVAEEVLVVVVVVVVVLEYADSTAPVDAVDEADPEAIGSDEGDEEALSSE
jgi:hypothetical protein